MTTLGQTNFTGGAPGTAVTTTTEPLFTSFGGSGTYRVPYGTTQGLEPSSTTAGNYFISSLPGTSPWLIAWKVTFTSSTAATGIYRMVQIRNGTTLVADASLRNNAGTREVALRNSSTSVVAGQTTGDPMTAGATWCFELAYAGTTMTLKIWKNQTGTGTADYTGAPWTQTISSATFNMFIGPDTSTGVVATISDLTITDGSTIFGGGGSLVLARNGESESDTIRVQTKMTGATNCRLKYSTDPTFVTGSAFTTLSAPDSDGYFKASVTGLAADTAYYWQVEVDGTLNTTLQGSTRTLKPAGAPQSFRFLFGSCYDTTTSGVFALQAARTPHFVVGLGDEGYPHAASAPFGNPAPANTATLRTAREATILATGPRSVYAAFPYTHMYSDGDGAGGNSDGTFAAAAGGNLQAAWRQQYANRTLPLSDCGARSWVVGRVRFVLTDETTLSSAKAATDNSSKTKLGTTQKAWFKNEIDQARGLGQVVVWFGDGPILEQSSPGAGGNSWWFYQTEANELGAYIAAAGMRDKLVRLHGDTHTLFADDGTNNAHGSFASFSAAPMHTTAQAFGGTVTNGKFPAAGPVNTSRQYGVCDVTDDGTRVTLALNGWASTNAAPTETNPVTMTLTMLPPKPAAFLQFL